MLDSLHAQPISSVYDGGAALRCFDKVLQKVVVGINGVQAFHASLGDDRAVVCLGSVSQNL